MPASRARATALASGEIKLWQAGVFLAALLAIGLGILLLFNRLTVGLGISSLLLVALYPLMKRVTWWPQLFLGFTFNWGALMGWSAMTNSIGLTALVLYIAGIFWTLGYDTIYAHQDAADDARIGIKSTALLFGARSPAWVALFYAVAILLLALDGWIASLGGGYYLLLLVGAAYMAAQLMLWEMGDRENCLKRFIANRDFGLIVLVGIIAGKFF